MRLEYVRTGWTLSIYNGRKLLASCKVYDKKHDLAIRAKFDAWSKLGWPYIPEDERK